MSTFKTIGHVGADRKLTATVPEGFENRDVSITIESGAAVPPRTREELAAALDRVIGSIDDPTFIRHPQGDFEQRDSLD